MSYLVLARRWRPQTFEEIRGQDHIARALRNAITSRRIAHAYLFTGIRGVGKTSAARVLAKALNCAEGPTPTPCNVCDSCREITEGKSPDVLEIDGASNTGVEDVRRLREAVRYPPVRSPYRVYIIDEVHMLSTAAFNALLKTLEEPPAHVVFIFATTDAHKIPVTILSRCQQFDFKPAVAPGAHGAPGRHRPGGGHLDRREEPGGPRPRGGRQCAGRPEPARPGDLVLWQYHRLRRRARRPRRGRPGLLARSRPLRLGEGRARCAGAPLGGGAVRLRRASVRPGPSGRVPGPGGAQGRGRRRGPRGLGSGGGAGGANLPGGGHLGGDPRPLRHAEQGGRRAAHGVPAGRGLGDDAPQDGEAPAALVPEPGAGDGGRSGARGRRDLFGSPASSARRARGGVRGPATQARAELRRMLGGPAGARQGPVAQKAAPSPPTQETTSALVAVEAPAAPAPAAPVEPAPSEPTAPEVTAATAVAPDPSPTVRDAGRVWDSLLAGVERSNRPFWTVLKGHGRLVSWDPDGRLAVVGCDDASQAFLWRPKLELITAALEGFVGRGVRVELRFPSAEERKARNGAADSDRARSLKKEALEHPLVREALEIFDGDVEEVRALKP